MFIVINLAPR